MMEIANLLHRVVTDLRRVQELRQEALESLVGGLGGDVVREQRIGSEVEEPSWEDEEVVDDPVDSPPGEAPLGNSPQID